MYKKLFFIFSAFLCSAWLSGCEPESVEVEVTREVPVEIEIEVTREVSVEVEVERIVVVTPAGDVPAPAVVVEDLPETEAEVLPTVLRLSHSLIWAGEESLDPYEPTRFADYSLLAYERLIRLDESGNLVPSLATAWEANSDGTVWTLTLREGVLFHDGAEMGPADVAYSLERMIAPNGGSTLAPVLQSIAAVAVAGDNQITVGLSAPDYEFPLLLTDPRAVVLRNNGGDSILQDGIGTGPFKLDSVDTQGITELSAFAGYWGGRSSIDQVAIISIPDEESRVQAMLAGQIDILDRIDSSQKTQFEGSNEFSLQSVPTGNWRGFVMRTDTAPFDNPAVRQALRVVADRQALVETVLGGAGTVACDHPVWQGDQYWTEISCPQDIELAKSLLAEAGYANGISVELHTSPLDPIWPNLIEAYQAQAQAAGIIVTVVEDPVETFWSNTWLIDPFITTSWNERPAPLILNEAWRSSAAWNETYWNSAEFDALLDSAAAEPDLAVRQEQYGQLQTILWESGGAFIPFHLDQTRVVSSCIAGVLPTAAEHIDFSLIVKTPNCN